MFAWHQPAVSKLSCVPEQALAVEQHESLVVTAEGTGMHDNLLIMLSCKTAEYEYVTAVVKHGHVRAGARLFSDGVSRDIARLQQQCTTIVLVVVRILYGIVHGGTSIVVSTPYLLER